MTDIAITPTNVVAGANAVRGVGTAGVAITAGQWIYKDSTTLKYLLADNNAVDPLARIPEGVALNGASPNQPINFQTGGDITIGGTLIAGTDYFLSSNPGFICPRADLVAGMNVVLVGLAKSTTVLAIDIQIPGVTL
jgi:hypothetical protein